MRVARGIVLLAPLLLSACGVQLGSTGLECQRSPANGQELREGEDPMAPNGPLAGVDVSAMSAAQIGELAEEAGIGVTYRLAPAAERPRRASRR